MNNRLSTYKIKDWVVLGRTFFKPPFKVSDTLINEARIVYIVNGHSNLYAANQFTTLQSGDTIVMKSDNFINNWMANQTSDLNEVIVFQITSDLLKQIYDNQIPHWFVENRTNQVFPIQKVKANFFLKEFFENLRNYLSKPELISEELLRIKIQELLYILVKTDSSGSNREIFGSLFRSNEYEFQEVIQTHLFDDLNIDDLAFLSGMSLSSFKRKFATVYGTSPNKYLISRRLEKAQGLLRITNLRISEVAYECGYSDVGYFTKTFQKYYSCSPSSFRDKLLG